MIRQLKIFLSWLERRFPAKVTLTQDDYEELLVVVNKHIKLIEFHSGQLAGLDDRIGNVEKSIAGVKDLLAKNGNLMLRSEADKLRDNFIREGFVRETAKS